MPYTTCQITYYIKISILNLNYTLIKWWFLNEFSFSLECFLCCVGPGKVYIRLNFGAPSPRWLRAVFNQIIYQKVHGINVLKVLDILP